jgi:hypothetical protein
MEPGVTRAQLRDPETNLRIGFKYLRYLIDKYEGDEKLALLAYNRGPGTVDRALRQGRNPDNGYADFVYGQEEPRAPALHEPLSRRGRRENARRGAPDRWSAPFRSRVRGSVGVRGRRASRFFSMYSDHSGGTSVSGKIAWTGHSGSQAPQSMHSSGLM